MLYKEDWDKARERLLAWWEGELIDRAVIQVKAPRDGAGGDSRWDDFFLVRHHEEPELVIEEWEKYCRGTFFGGEMIPNLWINLGPGIPAAYLGCRLRVSGDTVWFEPPGDLSLKDILALGLDENEKWWKTTRELTALAAESGKGKYITGLTDLNSVFDILCHLRGTQRLLYDLIDSPAEVKQACELINNLWLTCYNELADISMRYQQGSAFWMNIWCPGRGSDVQCDFSAMISPEMFEEFVLDHLTREIRNADQSVFHLDGPGQIPHLDILLEISELNGIQWVPGAGNPPTGSSEWFPMYRRIQEKGKLLVLQNMDKEDVEGVLYNLSSRGLLIETKCDSESEARDLLANAAKWTRD